MRGRSRRRFLQVSFTGLATVLAGYGFPGGEGEEEGGENGGGGESGEGGETGGDGEGGENDDDRSATALGPDE